MLFAEVKLVAGTRRWQAIVTRAAADASSRIASSDWLFYSLAEAQAAADTLLCSRFRHRCGIATCGEWLLVGDAADET